MGRAKNLALFVERVCAANNGKKIQKKRNSRRLVRGRRTLSALAFEPQKRDFALSVDLAVGA
jgi:hypothetical protein